MNANALTSLLRVKRHLAATDPTTLDGFDDVFEDLINQESDRLEAKLGRTVREQTYTRYLSGDDTTVLRLPEGPLDSVTSVDLVEYDDAGDGSREETLTEVEEYQRLEGGLRDDGYLGLGWIERIDGSTFAAGRRNYKVVFVAGFELTTEDVADDPTQVGAPEALIRWATYRVAATFVNREAPGLLSRSIGDGTQAYLSAKQMDDAEDRVLNPFFAGRVA
jgi:hypothetical protein